ncbi:MAG: hypothetical protein IKI69_00615 [Oscillospiraceae bacterium]|nr:hypothetical protein [Oscillospiraceae bacterium]
MMQNLEELAKELQRRGQAEQLKNLAASLDGQKLSAMLDQKALAEAAKSGDTEALRRMMSGILGTAEGQRLSAAVQKLLGEKNHG